MMAINGRDFRISRCIGKFLPMARMSEVLAKHLQLDDVADQRKKNHTIRSHRRKIGKWQPFFYESTFRHGTD